MYIYIYLSLSPFVVPNQPHLTPAVQQPLALMEKKASEGQKSILKKSETPPPSPPQPPAPAASRDDVKFARVLFDFLPENDDELYLQKGEIFVIVGYEDDEWAEGQTKDGRQGLFPLNYVEEVSESEIDTMGGQAAASGFRAQTEKFATQSGPGTMDVFSSEKQQRYWDLVEKISAGEGTYQDNQEVRRTDTYIYIYIYIPLPVLHLPLPVLSLPLPVLPVPVPVLSLPLPVPVPVPLHLPLPLPSPQPKPKPKPKPKPSPNSSSNSNPYLCRASHVS